MRYPSYNMNMVNLSLIILFSFLKIAQAKTHTFHFTTGWKNVTIPGLPHPKQVISFNNQWPLPEIHVNKGDRVQVYLTNGFNDSKTLTSLHFHGLFQNTSDGNSLQMDGPAMITQCPIVPGETYLYNFTVDNQVGTYWYHAHNGAQYGDGMRGAFIIHDPEVPFSYDEDITVTISDLYYRPYYELEKEFLSRYNPMGNEPIPDDFLFNDIANGNLKFDLDKTYLVRFVNVGLFVSQYLTLENHEFTIVEADGVYVKPKVTDVLYIAAGQRISVLIHSKKNDPKKNFALMQVIDESMLDSVPKGLRLQIVNQVTYSESYPKAEILSNSSPDELEEKVTNEFDLTTLDEEPIYKEYNRQIILDVRMGNLGDGVKYAFFNNITFVPPRIPVLTTVLTAGKLVTNPEIYGDNINVFILEKDEIVEIVLNNYDPGRHPFHLHGHNFQIVQKSPGFHIGEAFDESLQDEMTVPYNESNPLMDYPVHPMIRDTAVLEPNGHLVLRFKANNPGVWFFHCHVDWHLQQGLAAVFIEDPLTLQKRETLTDNYKQICSKIGMANKGNAAGHSDDWLNMEGLPRQPRPLPAGFTAKGYYAFFVSVLVGLYGLYSIARYGLMEVIADDQQTYDTLKKVLDDNKVSY